jgi:hypothetical protein
MFEGEGGYEEKVWRGDEYWYEKATLDKIESFGNMDVRVYEDHVVIMADDKVMRKIYVGTGDLGPN